MWRNTSCRRKRARSQSSRRRKSSRSGPRSCRGRLIRSLPSLLAAALRRPCPSNFRRTPLGALRQPPDLRVVEAFVSNAWPQIRRLIQTPLHRFRCLAQTPLQPLGGLARSTETSNAEHPTPNTQTSISVYSYPHVAP